MDHENNHTTNTSNNQSSDQGETTQSQRRVRPRQMSISSDEVNYLVYRYLQECGFVHAAYSFSHESNLLLSHPTASTSWRRTADETLPPGALISFLQKGLQYIGMEESLSTSDDSKKQSDDFSLLSRTTLQALSRNPTIQLIVKPDAAAAAIRAQLELGNTTTTNSTSITGNPKTEEEEGIPSSEEGGNNNGNMETRRTPAPPSAAVEENTGGVEREPPPPVDNHPTVDDEREQQRPPSTTSLGTTNNNDTQDATMKMENGPTLTGEPQRVDVTEERAFKKQKTESESLEQIERTRGFSTLEQARAKLEADKQTKRGAATESDGRTQLRDFMNGKLPSLMNGSSTARHHSDGAATNEDTDSASVNGGSSLAPDHHLLGIEQGESGEIDEEESHNEEEETTASMENNVPDEDGTTVKPEEILLLEQHESEVFMCSWNPIFTNLIATGSGDASARIWEMNEDKTLGLKSSTKLPHSIETGDNKNKDVTTLEWSSNGLLLATGSYDGIARVWDRKGTLIQTLRGHTGPIFSLKWNQKGNFLLSGSYDKTIIVWNVSTIGHHTNGREGEFIERQYKDHDAPALDVDWKDDECFASCSTDRSVHVYDVSRDGPLKVYRGHEDEVNAVKWSPSGRYLASCSDDCTAKIWDTQSDMMGPLHDFNDHEQEIYTVKWSPTGPGSANPSKAVSLATASFDGSIRLWNVLDGSCIGFLNAHQDSVYSVAFSPSGEYLASGSLAGQMYIWDLSLHRYIKSYRGGGDIFEVSWNKEETRVAACFSSNVIAVVDFDRAAS